MLRVLILSAATAFAHAPILPPAVGPFTVSGNRITGAAGTPILLRGVEGDLAHLNAKAFGVLRIRWNLNAVHVPVPAGTPLERLDSLLRDASEHTMAVAFAFENEADRLAATERFSTHRSALFAPSLRFLRLAADLSTDNEACRALPRTGNALRDLIYSQLLDAASEHVFVAGFRPGGLIRDTEEYEPTTIDASVVCGSNAPQGIGEIVLLWSTGDTSGFGYLTPDRIASAAGGPATPIAPGQLISIYVEQLGPETAIRSSPDEQQRLPLTLGGTTVWIDGIKAPVLAAHSYQLDVQVPYEVRPGTEATMRIEYRGVSSNRARVPVVTAAPELFHDSFTRLAVALNEDGTRNGKFAPATPGSVITLFATGGGLASPQTKTGALVSAPHPALLSPVSVEVGGLPALIRFAGEVPGFAGLNQINAQIPALPAGEERAVPIRVLAAGRSSVAPVFLQVR